MLLTLTQAKSQLKTVADYNDLPMNSRVQLIDGEFRMSPSPTRLHQRIVLSLAGEMDDFVSERKLGEVNISPLDVQLTEFDVYQPDIVFVSNDRAHFLTPEGIAGAPDLVIEVLSPGNAFYDLRSKKQKYERARVREYWIIDPMDRSIEAFANSEEGFHTTFLAKEGMLCSSVLPEFCVDVAEVFDV